MTTFNNIRTLKIKDIARYWAKESTEHAASALETILADGLRDYHRNRLSDPPSRFQLMDIDFAISRESELTRDQLLEITDKTGLKRPRFWGTEAKSNRASTAAAETRCFGWLKRLMESGPQLKAKQEYFEDAYKRFGVGRNAFDRAWALAIKETGNLEWGKSGRRPKRVKGEATELSGLTDLIDGAQEPNETQANDRT